MSQFSLAACETQKFWPYSPRTDRNLMGIATSTNKNSKHSKLTYTEDKKQRSLG